MKVFFPTSHEIRKMFRANSLFSKIYYGLRIDDLWIMFGSKSYKKEQDRVVNIFMTPEEQNDFNLVEKVKKDMKNSYFLGKFSPIEYFLFNLGKKSKKERLEYISDKVIYINLANVVGRKIHDLELEDKFNFYKLTSNYFMRDVCFVSSETDRSEFTKMAKKHRKLILKPNCSACGNGIMVKQVETEEQINNAFDEMLDSGIDWIVEELIKQSASMAVWNESSVNTIRLSSFLNKDGFHILCPFMRMGQNGAIVDNGGQGGIYAVIDVTTGKILTNGRDEKNNSYVKHPDSGVIYKGWQIPLWKELLVIVEKIHYSMPKHKYIAWDFALTDKGWVLIEGNWGEFICQQSTTGKGYKKEFLKLIMN